MSYPVGTGRTTCIHLTRLSNVVGKIWPRNKHMRCNGVCKCWWFFVPGECNRKEGCAAYSSGPIKVFHSFTTPTGGLTIGVCVGVNLMCTWAGPPEVIPWGQSKNPTPEKKGPSRSLWFQPTPQISRKSGLKRSLTLWSPCWKLLVPRYYHTSPSAKSQAK